MARSKKLDHAQVRPRVFESVQELDLGIEKLRSRIDQVEELKKDGIPYRDAMRVSAEFQLRETIRDIFGERSPEFQEHQHHHIKSTSKADLAETRALLEELIGGLEAQKNHKLGLAPPPPPKPIAPPAARHSESKPKAAAATPTVSPAAVPVDPEPTPQALHPRPAGFPPLPPPPSPQPTPNAATPVPSPTAAPVEVTHRKSAGSPAAAPRGASSRSTGSPPTPTGDPKAGIPVVQHPIEIIRKICGRFHAVARSLRHRRDERPTLEVEDEADVLDVVHALLTLEFDEIHTEEWTPSYARTSRMDIRVPDHGIVIQVKKTRPGFGPKEIGSQLAVDFQHYQAIPDWSMLFCFVYDPEGRIGNPVKVETDLTRTSEGRYIEVLISPK
ncbi:MAG: hypothetical protein ACREI3_05015 [Nitrospirales bacterium]